ncbi:Fibrinogen C domain-containing protein 1-B [Amphibalanus amphitrite]|uniref:Fibrinogen C domain-containing protein 1-B n=1 Tax=Amphibalanus amphitrite TaxID=1232801 RepID=A0A6A4WBX2_AMPAM|nr:Fibrinogen C domain-containing protein 1-B [Amphibalanus amphitrite]
MAVRPLGSSVCLLALLCAVSRCALADSDSGAGTRDALDDLLALVNRAVRETVDPISAELRSQRELMSDILSRLSSQDARTDQLNLRLSEQQDTFNSRLDQLNVRLDTISAQSFSQLDSLREDFYRNWTEYKDGFGDLSGEFWWGLEKLWLMTETMGRRYDLRVDLEDFDEEKRYARTPVAACGRSVCRYVTEQWPTVRVKRAAV